MQIQVMLSLAFKAAYLDLVPRFEREAGVTVQTQFVGGAEMGKRLRAGEVTDLVIMAAKGIDELIAEGLLVKGSRVDLVRSKIGVAVKSGAPRPDISSADSLKRALHAAKSIAYSSGPSGVYLADVFKEWQLPPAKLHQSAPGMPAGEFVARGESEIGFQQISELLPVEGIDYIGPLPPSSNWKRSSPRPRAPALNMRSPQRRSRASSRPRQWCRPSRSTGWIRLKVR